MATVVADLVAKLGLKPDVKSWSKGDELIHKVKEGIAFFAGFEAVKTVAEWVKATAEIGDHAIKASQKLGITTEAIQELGHAAQLSGVSQEGLEGALGKLAKNLDTVAQTGKGPAADALKRLGIHARDLKGESLDQNLEVIADRFAKMPDGAAKASLAMDLFGKSGRELIPLLNEGQEGIVALRNEAEELGIVIGEDDARAMEKFNDDNERLHKTLGGLRNQVVVALLPAFQEMVDGVREWITANKEVIKSTIAGALRIVAGVFKVVGAAIKGVVKVIQFFIENSELGESVLIALGAAVTVFAAQAAAAWIIAAAPIILLVAAIAGIVFGIKMLIKHWDLVKAKGLAAVNALREGFGNMWQDVKDVGNAIKDFFVEDIPRAIVSAFDALWQSVKDGAHDAVAGLRNLPIVKQALDLVGAPGLEATGGGGGDGGAADAIRAFESASRAAEGPTAANTVQQKNEFHIEINGASNATEVMQQVNAQIQAHMETLLQQTAEAVG